MGNERDVRIQEVETVLKEWRQGDCVIGEHWFLYRFSPQIPLTHGSIELAQEETSLGESEVRGFAVVTQTCDIIRSCSERPFIEIVPLVEVDEQQFHNAQRGRLPRYAYISGVSKFNLVTDLDRVMTVEKAVVAEWQRISGCQNDQEIRAFGQALARKRVRFAFPDDFIEFVKKLQKRMQDKHSKPNAEGEALRALREIRVYAEPSWDASKVRLIFFFIRHEEQNQFQQIEWDQLRKQWLQLLPETEEYRFEVDGIIRSLEDMTAKEYVESDPLDLDHLSFYNSPDNFRGRG